MKKKLLNIKEIDKICVNCVYGIHTPDESGVLCQKKGVMTNNSSCHKFEYDPLNRTPARPMALEVPDAENFKL